ncbi:MAG: DUF2752 domain-containing protein [Ruminococcus sp.]|nr:DUF2752 domain-containing protein [Ruminococcus sp.]
MLQKTWVRIILLMLPLAFVMCCIFLRDLAVYIAENILPPCDSYSHLGIYCPGCGLTRCILAIMYGRLWLALRCNAAVFCIFIAAMLLYAEIALLSFGKDIHLLPRKAWVWITFAFIAVIYLVLRNFIPEIMPPDIADFVFL